MHRNNERKNYYSFATIETWANGYLASKYPFSFLSFFSPPTCPLSAICLKATVSLSITLASEIVQCPLLIVKISQSPDSLLCTAHGKKKGKAGLSVGQDFRWKKKELHENKLEKSGWWSDSWGQLSTCLDKSNHTQAQILIENCLRYVSEKEKGKKDETISSIHTTL